MISTLFPELFTIGDFTVTSFGPLVALAFFVAQADLGRNMQRLGVGNSSDAITVALTALFAGLLGARLYYAALYQDWTLLWGRAGFVWYGGFLCAAVAVIVVLRRRGIPLAGGVDAVAPSLAVGYGLGRLACFMVGDDYGVPTSLPWAVRFPEGMPPSTAHHLRGLGVDIPPQIPGSEVLAVHPTQLYETAAGVAIWALGVWLLGKRLRAGRTGLTVLTLLTLERFLVEFLRAKDDRLLAGYTLAQLISLLLLTILGVAWYYVTHPTKNEVALE